MKLYLLRHGEAKSKDEDPEQALTDNGQAAVLRVASFAQGAGVSATAEIIAGLLKPTPALSASDGLDPMDEPGIWMSRLDEEKQPIMLVGHLPYMGRLASVLLCGNSEKETITFTAGSMLCLHRSTEGAWTVQWMITPAMLR
jgi:phosphohistidine phosphatase